MNKKSDVPTKEGDSISKDDVLDQNPIDDTKESGLEEASLLNGEEQERSLSPEEELEELKDRHLRLQADFENVRKRAARDRQEAFNYGHESLVKKVQKNSIKVKLKKSMLILLILFILHFWMSGIYQNGLTRKRVFL